ncbi:MAG: hypothetical protein FWD63_09780 [Propionibacteriaceae bacterium]|nr:hypothetical protein [Propionibacteriaceae bacterium]
MDDYDENEPFTRLISFDENRPEQWNHIDLEFLVSSVCLWPETQTAPAVSEEGDVFFWKHDMDAEVIPDAGVSRETAKGYGHLSDVQLIGQHLYACGTSGQVYRRDGKDNWVHMDDGILQNPEKDGGWFMASAVNGPHEQAIYLAGCDYNDGYPPHVEFWDGHQWRRLELPDTAGRITNIYVESEDRILMCGDDATLLVGNARDGFSMLGPAGGKELFYSITKFNGLYFLGSNLGLFRFDPNKNPPAFEEVQTGLSPELGDANIVQSIDGVLWSLGSKDIARFNGTTWQRFEHPDNPSIAQMDKQEKARLDGVAAWKHSIELANLTAQPGTSIAEHRRLLGELLSLTTAFPSDSAIAKQFAAAAYNMTTRANMTADDVHTVIANLDEMRDKFPQAADIAELLAQAISNLMVRACIGLDEKRALSSQLHQLVVEKFARNRAIIYQYAWCMSNLAGQSGVGLDETRQLVHDIHHVYEYFESNAYSTADVAGQLMMAQAMLIGRCDSRDEATSVLSELVDLINKDSSPADFTARLNRYFGGGPEDQAVLTQAHQWSTETLGPDHWLTGCLTSAQ